MKKLLTLEQMIAHLQAKQGDKSASGFAKEFGISRQYLMGIYAGLWAPGPKIVRKLGFRRVERITMYEEVR